MPHSLSSLLRRFRDNERGAAVVAFAISVIPVMGLVGAGFDYSRATHVRNELQNALDAATLSVALDQEVSEQQTGVLIRDRMQPHLNDSEGYGLTVSARRNVDENLIDSWAEMKIETGILSIIGVDYIEVAADSAVSAEYDDLEVALVLDNTGSMARGGRIRTLRTAAQDFVDIVTSEGRNDYTYISVVPYVASVNIGNSSTLEGYLDKDGRARYHAELIEGKWLTKYNHCSWPSGGGGGSNPWDNTGSGDDGASLAPSLINPIMNIVEGPVAAAGNILQELIGVTPALAYDPYTFQVWADCYPVNPDPISHWQLFQQTNTEWKGCVEARPEPYDVLDTPPSANDPDSLWVPYFWIDDADAYAEWTDNHGNDWIDDTPFIEDTEMYRNNWGRTYSVLKYNTDNPMRIDEVPPITSGPNKSCGDPILPLTNNYRSISDRIDRMVHWNGGGTQTSQGVVWGWRALSPSPPFMEGKPYEDVMKVMIVMTDGANWIGSSENNSTLSAYTSYGHLRMGRMGRSTRGAREYIDRRTVEACKNAKDAGVIVYTVTLGLRDRDARQVWDDCATEESMSYHVRTASELVGAFNSIAGAVGQLRLTR